MEKPLKIGFKERKKLKKTQKVNIIEHFFNVSESDRIANDLNQVEKNENKKTHETNV